MDHKLKFITLAGFNALHYCIYSPAREFNKRGMPAYAELQQAEFTAESLGCSATRRQREVGSGYFDEVSVIISGESRQQPPCAVPARPNSFIAGRLRDAKRSGKRGIKFAKTNNSCAFHYTNRNTG